MYYLYMYGWVWFFELIINIMHVGWVLLFSLKYFYINNDNCIKIQNGIQNLKNKMVTTTRAGGKPNPIFRIFTRQFISWVNTFVLAQLWLSILCEYSKLITYWFMFRDEAIVWLLGPMSPIFFYSKNTNIYIYIYIYLFINFSNLVQ